MSKYVEPPKSKETSSLENVTNAAEKEGASFINTVEQACSDIADSVQKQIEDMIQGAVDAATGAYNAVVDGIDVIGDAFDSAEKESDVFASDLEEGYDDIKDDENLTENSNMQGDIMEDADEKTNNLTPKETKEIVEEPAKKAEMSKGLTDSGLDKMKGNVLNG